MRKLGVIPIILYVLYIIGWALCVIKLVECDFASPYKAEVIYSVGIFTGLGGILGWFDFGK